MKYILVSACLLGVRCKYNGEHNLDTRVASLMQDPEICLIPVCPEQLGGLPTPRDPSERHGDKIIQRTGTNVTEAFEKARRKPFGLRKFTDAKSLF